MKKFITHLVMVVAVAAMMASCSTATPSDHAEDIVKCMQKGNYAEMADFMYVDTSNPQSVERKEMMASIFEEKVSNGMEKMQGIVSYKMGEEIIAADGKTATVDVYFVYGNGEEYGTTIDFENIDGDWYLSTKK